MFASALPSENPLSSVAGQSHFQRAVQTKKFAIGDFETNRVTGQPELSFGYPVFDQNPELKRIVSASVRLDLLSETILHIPLPTDATVTVFDRRGNVPDHFPNPEKRVGSSLGTTALAKWALVAKKGVAELTGLEGDLRLYAVTPIGESQSPSLFSAVGIPISASYAPEPAIATQLCGVGGRYDIAPGHRLGSTQIAYLSNRSTHWLRQQVESSRGDFSARTGIAPKVAELSKLAGAFDSMASALERRQSEVERARHEIAEAEEKFRTLVEQSLVGIYVIQDGRFAYVNPKMCEVLATTAQELASRPIGDFVLEEDRSLVTRIFGNVSMGLCIISGTTFGCCAVTVR